MSSFPENTLTRYTAFGSFSMLIELSAVLNTNFPFISKICVFVIVCLLLGFKLITFVAGFG